MISLQEPRLLKPLCLIGGEWCHADSRETFDVRNPATGEVLARVPAAGQHETQRAIVAAEQALPAWRKRPAGERAALVRAWHALILDHAEDLAQLLTAEQGKPLSDARGEVAHAASFVDWFAVEAHRVYGDVI